MSDVTATTEEHPLAEAMEHAIAPDVVSLPAMISDAKHGFLPVPLEMLDAVAERLSSAAATIRPQFAGKLDACWLVGYQAARWGMDPVAVLSKAYLTTKEARPGQALEEKGTIAYEAQLIHALINRFAPIRGGIKFEYGYGGDGTKTIANRFCRASVVDIRTGETKSVTSPTIAQIKVKNSPLWYADGDQQLAYYTGRSLGRRYYPEVLLGVYAVDEVYQEVRDLSPRRDVAIFEEEVQDAEFGDAPGPSAEDLAANARWEKKASGVGDSRDPRDADANKPAPPPAGSAEPEDMPAIRIWALGEGANLCALTDPSRIAQGWQLVAMDKRWGRFKAYDQASAKKVHDSVNSRIQQLKDAKATGADPGTGEVK